MKHLGLIGFLITPLLISACGGGSGGGGGAGSNLTVEQRIEAGPEGYTPEQFQSLYDEYNTSLYQGRVDQAQMDFEMAQRVARLMQEVEYSLVPDFAYGVRFLINEYIESSDTGTYTSTRPCDNVGGNITVEGRKHTSNAAWFSIEWNDCELSPLGMGTGAHLYNGRGALYRLGSELEGEITEYVFFNKVSNRSGENFEQVTEVSGYYSYSSHDTNSAQLNVVSSAPGTNNTDQIILRVGYDRETAPTESGTVWLGQHGKVDISNIETPNSSPYGFSRSRLSGQNANVILDFVDYNLYQYFFDADKNDIPELAANFQSISAFINATAESVIFHEVDGFDIGRPPLVGTPTIQNGWNILATDEIVARPGYIDDQDSPLNELVTTYSWRVNGVVVAGVTGASLPSGYAFGGDSVSVAMIVSDGRFTSTSEYSWPITLGDSPATLTISSLPTAPTQAGEETSFRAIMADPDLPTGTGAATMISSPAGATIDDSGLVRWSTDNEELMFSLSTQSFLFDSGNPYLENIEVEISVENSAAPLPIARSKVNTTGATPLMIIDNFTVSESKEILVTDKMDALYLLKLIDGQYQHYWQYPYKLQTKGNISHLFAANIDDDAQKEIVVVTQHGISLIPDLRSAALTLWSTKDHRIDAFAAHDIDNDGKPEIAVVTSSIDDYYAPQTLKILHFDNFETPLFETPLSSRTSALEFGNVDSDSNIELVIDQGLVYDTSNWSNQWFSSSRFSEEKMILADINNDNVDEIIGLSSTNDQLNTVNVHFAQTRTRFTQATDYYRICSLASANIDAQAGAEILLSPCFDDLIISHSWNENSLNEAQTLMFNDPLGSEINGLVIGNSDNDDEEELHWFSSHYASYYNSDFYVANAAAEGEYTLSVTEESSASDSMSAGWINITPETERAVFTARGRDGELEVTLISKEGVSEQLNFAGNVSHPSGTVTDFDNDGFGELFLTGASSAGFAVWQLHQQESLWSTPASVSRALIEHFDFNNDGSDDAIYAIEHGFNIVDVASQTLLTAIALDSIPIDLAIHTVDGITAYLVTSTPGQLKLWKRTGNSFANISTVSTTQLYCSRINFGNLDNDSELELVCLLRGEYHYSNTSFIVFEIRNEMLVETSRHDYDGAASDFVFDTSTTNNQALLVGARKEKYDAPYTHIECTVEKLQLLEERTLWSSAKLIGERVSTRSMRFRNVPSDSDQHRLMFTTDKTIYLVR